MKKKSILFMTYTYIDLNSGQLIHCAAIEPLQRLRFYIDGHGIIISEKHPMWKGLVELCRRLIDKKGGDDVQS